MKTDHTNFRSVFFLIDAISINLSELAKSMGYDPSYLSRIKKGQRMPADITKFAESLSAFLLRKYGGSEKIIDLQAAGLLHRKGYILHPDFTAAITRYLCSSEPKRKQARRASGII
ncbi:MAG: helix-turn-helix domain-containing protein [Ruminococcus callidus]